MPKHPTPPISRVLDRLDKTGECWRWLGTHNPAGRPQVGGQRGKKYLVYRVVYEHFVGPIPEGLTIDHLCGNGWCCNPAHLEAVSMEENYRRKWEDYRCPKGHEPDWYHYSSGRKACKPCVQERRRNR